MALTRQLIEITFGNAIAQAKVLEECADDMERLVSTNIAEIDSELRGAWKGESAEMYLNKMDICGGNIQKNAQQLRNIATSLRRVAKVFRDTELRAIELAKTAST